MEAHFWSYLLTVCARRLIRQSMATVAAEFGSFLCTDVATIRALHLHTLVITAKKQFSLTVYTDVSGASFTFYFGSRCHMKMSWATQQPPGLKAVSSELWYLRHWPVSDRIGNNIAIVWVSHWAATFMAREQASNNKLTLTKEQKTGSSHSTLEYCFLKKEHYSEDFKKLHIDRSSSNEERNVHFDSPINLTLT